MAPSPVIARRPARTSSGLTDGIPCRKTISSIAHSPWLSARLRMLPPIPGIAPKGTTPSRTTAARESNVRSPFLVIRSTRHLVGVQEPAYGVGGRGVRHAREAAPPDAALEQVGQRAALRDHDLEHVEPGRQRLVEGGEQRCGVADLGEGDLEVLRLARGPGGRRSGVRDAGVGMEPGGVGHRDAGADDRPLERPREVPMAGEPEPAALGVAHPDALHRRCLLLGLVAHGRTLPRGSVTPPSARGCAGG